MNIDKAATSAEKVAKRFREIGDALRGEKTMKTIEDAVIYHNGVLPVEDGGFLVYHKKEDEYSVSYDACIHTHAEQIVCNEQEFEACAKRLGYINGYRWGVEYPTNGERPDLPDDVVIEPFYDDEWHHGMKCGTLDWRFDSNECDPVAAFRITDPRYKPADTSYLNASTQAKSLTHSEEGLTHSDWFDYEMHKSVNPAPVGTKLIVDCFDKGWKDAVVIGSFERWNWIDIAGVGLETVDLCRIKPLDHATRKSELERQKVIEAAVMVVESNNSTSESIYDTLYNAGMLVLTPKKSDTKD